jgi:hypothetical protein
MEYFASFILISVTSIASIAAITFCGLWQRAQREAHAAKHGAKLAAIDCTHEREQRMEWQVTAAKRTQERDEARECCATLAREHNDAKEHNRNLAREISQVRHDYGDLKFDYDEAVKVIADAAYILRRVPHIDTPQDTE